MPTRISTGISVQATSIKVLWVVLEGIGFDLALNLITTATRSPRTNSVMTVMSTSRKLWNQVMFSITGVAASCSLYSHGAGCPNSADAAPLAASATPPSANPSNRAPIWPFDSFMPFALLKSKPQRIPPHRTGMPHDPPPDKRP